MGGKIWLDLSMSTFFVYIVKTSNGNLYTGIAIDPIHRVFEHNNGSKGAKCLRGQRPVVLVWASDGQTRSQALKLENRIKKLSHKDKVLLVKRSRDGT